MRPPIHHGRLRDKILLVDDDLQVLSALERVLRADGYETLRAQCGKEALQVIKNEDVAVIVCDQNLPDITGVQVLARALQIQPPATRVILTGDHDLNLIVDAINVGQISQFVLKPWDDELFRQTVRTACQSYHLYLRNENLQERIIDQHRELAQTHLALRQELEIGARIHRVLLRGKTPERMEGVDLAAATEPSKQIDGDFYDFHSPSSHILDVAVGDVMGKGIPAALVGTAVKTLLRRFAVPLVVPHLYDDRGVWIEDLLPPAKVIDSVQRELGQQLIDLEFFATLFYARIDFNKRLMTYVDCGSTKPILYRVKEKKIEFLEGCNFPLGTLPNDEYIEKQVGYEPGDIFVLYSDGITEAQSPDGELFGIDRFIDLIRFHADLPPRPMLHLLKESVLQYTSKEGLDDDLTLIVMKMDEVGREVAQEANIAKFSADLEQLDPLRKWVGEMSLNSPGDSHTLSYQLQLVVDEAFANVVKHGYRGSKGQIHVRCEKGGEGIWFELADQGESFDPTQVAHANLAGDQFNGFGIFLMKELSEELVYSPKSHMEGWNRLRIYKKYLIEEETMEFSHRRQEDVLVVKLEGANLDAKEAPQFKERIGSLLLREQIRNVVFDLEELEFIDSSGLGAFLSVLRQLNGSGGDLKLAHMSKPIKTMFEIVRMHKLFDIFQTSDDAIKSFETVG